MESGAENLGWASINSYIVCGDMISFYDNQLRTYNRKIKVMEKLTDKYYKTQDRGSQCGQKNSK